jgi:predicted enzyme related to lactoylglutathione lyase
MLQKLRTIVYKVSDLDKAKAWYSDAFGISPYFDQPFYVGFDINGCELALDPSPGSTPSPSTSITYWSVADIAAAVARLLSVGATIHEDTHEVGDGIYVASVNDPFGNIIGLIHVPDTFKP